MCRLRDSKEGQKWKNCCLRGETKVANKKYLFLHEVTEQIKSKEAKKYVADELGYHL